MAGEAARDELLHTIDDEAARLNDLVGNLLDMSRLRSGEVGTRPQIVDVEEIVGARSRRCDQRRMRWWSTWPRGCH